MIRHVLFDFDGTLLDTNEIIVTSLRQAAKTYRGRDIDPEELDAILGKPLDVQMQALDADHAQAMEAFYRKQYRAQRDSHTKPFEGIKAMLDKLLELKLSMGIVSNKGTAGIQHGLQMFDMESYFATVVSADDVQKRKPDPEGLFQAIEALGGTPETCVFVGDSAHDIECGKRAGMTTILVGWTILNMEKLMASEPDYVASTPEAIVEIVKSML